MTVAVDPCRMPPDVFCAGAFKEVRVMASPHQHSQIELNYLLNGAMTYVFGERELRIAAGDFVFFWGANPHQSIAVDPGTRFICIYVPFDRFLALPLRAALMAAVMAGGVIAAVAAQPLDAAPFLRLYDDLLGDDRSLVELDRAEVELILRRVDVSGWRDLRARDVRRVERGPVHAKSVAMAKFISDNAARQINAADVARKVGLHPNYAMTIFRESFGMTLGDYLLRQRLHRAQALLTGTEDPMCDVAFASGFGSVSRFHAAFRGYFGMSPRRFRMARAAVAPDASALA